MNTRSQDELETKKLTSLVIFMSIVVFVLFGFAPSA